MFFGGGVGRILVHCLSGVSAQSDLVN